MHDAIPSRILNGWLRLEEDLFHLQVLSYLPPQIPIFRPQYTTLFSYRKDTEKQTCPRRACYGSPGTDPMHRQIPILYSRFCRNSSYAAAIVVAAATTAGRAAGNDKAAIA